MRRGKKSIFTTNNPKAMLENDAHANLVHVMVLQKLHESLSEYKNIFGWQTEIEKARTTKQKHINKDNSWV